MQRVVSVWNVLPTVVLLVPVLVTLRTKNSVAQEQALQPPMSSLVCNCRSTFETSSGVAPGLCQFNLHVCLQMVYNHQFSCVCTNAL